MDKLEKIFERQTALDEEITALRHLEGISREDWIQKDTLAIMAELGELISEVNFKWWKNPRPVEDAKVKEELIDVLHFFISMCARMGMDADELYEIYMGKNKENFDRQHGLSQKAGYKAGE